MPITVRSACGREFPLKDDLAGKLVRCPDCGEELRVPGGAPAPSAAAPDLDPVFMRRRFLLRQKHLAISEKYYVWDEGGQELLYIERPAQLLKSLVAVLAAGGAFAAVLGVFIGLTLLAGEGPMAAIFITIGLLGGLVAAVVAAIAASPKRHVYFFRDDTKREQVLTVEQDRKWTPINATYTVKDAAGRHLASLRKNYLFNLLRKRWYCTAPDGRLLSVIKEDSLILALLRRFLGPFFGLLRTNFVILKGDSEDVIGEFNRKLTILDRYVLDMTDDETEHLDRRIALAIGVMLDTGERR
jgi:uncharacterized protein YxjI